MGSDESHPNLYSRASTGNVTRAKPYFSQDASVCSSFPKHLVKCISVICKHDPHTPSCNREHWETCIRQGKFYKDAFCCTQENWVPSTLMHP